MKLKEWFLKRFGKRPKPESPAIRQQPKPRQNGYPNAHDEVSLDILRRKKLYVKEHGVELTPFNGRNVLVDAYQQTLDLALYLWQAIYEEDMRWDRTALLYLILDLVKWHCQLESGRLYSHGIDVFTTAIEVLHDENLVEIIGEHNDELLAVIKEENNVSD